MQNTIERRTDELARVPFGSLVEMRQDAHLNFEAQALNVSQEGMHLLTAYLPPVGQEVACHFDVGMDKVSALGRVVWRREKGWGGEFGVRFVDLDLSSAVTLDNWVTERQDRQKQEKPVSAAAPAEALRHEEPDLPVSASAVSESMEEETEVCVEESAGWALSAKQQEWLAICMASGRRIGSSCARVATRLGYTLWILCTRQAAPVAAIRRTTAPAPGGVLRTHGGRVVRQGSPARPSFLPPSFLHNPKRIGLGLAGVGGCFLLAVALRKPAQPPTIPVAQGAPVPAAPVLSPPSVEAFPSIVSPLDQNPSFPPASQEVSSPKLAGDSLPGAHPVRPFGPGFLGRGRVFRIPMNAPIRNLQGIEQPTGFVLLVPHCRVLTPGINLAHQDTRIAAFHATESPRGTEFSLQFKEGVPGYQVRSRKHVLEIVLPQEPEHAERAKSPALASVHTSPPRFSLAGGAPLRVSSRSKARPTSAHKVTLMHNVPVKVQAKRATLHKRSKSHTKGH